MAILFYFYNDGIFTSCIYGYSKSPVAANDCTNCKFWYSFSFWSDHNDCFDVYISISRIKWNITSMFMLAGIAGWAFGGFTGVETGWWGTNIYLHNTLNVVGHIHFVILMGSVLFALGLIYSIIPDLTKKNLSKVLGLVHLLLTLIGGFGLAFMFTFLGFAGVIRREAILPIDFNWALPLLLFFAFVIAIGQLLFIYNVIITMLRKKQTNEEIEYYIKQKMKIKKTRMKNDSCYKNKNFYSLLYNLGIIN